MILNEKVEQNWFCCHGIQWNDSDIEKMQNLTYQTENIAFDVFITMKLKIMNSSSLSFSTAFNIDWSKIATQRNGLYIEFTE